LASPSASTASACQCLFVPTLKDSLTSSNPFFRSAAAIIIARLLHAAALSGSTMADVVSWALDLERSTTARDILTDHPDAEMFWAQTLRTASVGQSSGGVGPNGVAERCDGRRQ
jgi:hypothetical protein